MFTGSQIFSIQNNFSEFLDTERELTVDELAERSAKQIFNSVRVAPEPKSFFKSLIKKLYVNSK